MVVQFQHQAILYLASMESVTLSTSQQMVVVVMVVVQFQHLAIAMSVTKTETGLLPSRFANLREKWPTRIISPTIITTITTIC